MIPLFVAMEISGDFWRKLPLSQPAHRAPQAGKTRACKKRATFARLELNRRLGAQPNYSKSKTSALLRFHDATANHSHRIEAWLSPATPQTSRTGLSELNVAWT
ncbi:MAG: hypothetical protein AB1813_11430 [Verrucomicrobiota bacterium]|jgi:hypothetical protein